MKKKVKICKNQQCQNRINKSDAAVCVGCGSSFRGISWQFLDEKEIEAILNPQLADNATDETEKVEEFTASDNTNSADVSNQNNAVPRRIIICPTCGKHIPYRVGLEYCDCGEYVQEELPVMSMEVSTDESNNCNVSNSQEQNYVEEVSATEEAVATEETADTERTEVTGITFEQLIEQIINTPKALRTIDGEYTLELVGEWMKVGRQAKGKIYFENAEKWKVSREHAILQWIDGN